MFHTEERAWAKIPVLVTINARVSKEIVADMHNKIQFSHREE